MLRKVFRFPFATGKRRVVTGILTIALASAVSFAAWSVITSSGSGAGQAGSLTAPTISNGTTLVPDMFPSSPTGSFNATGTLTMTINNPNSGALILTGFSLDDDAVIGGTAQCDWSSLRNTYLFVAGQGSAAAVAPAATYTGLNIAVPAGVSQVNVPAVLGLTSDTPSNCQGTSLQGFSVTNASFSTS